MDKTLSPENLAQIKKVLSEISLNSTKDSVIQDNKNFFIYKQKSYRTHMPNQEEQANAEHAQDKLKVDLIQNGCTITRKRLIKQLKDKQDIDIKAMEKEKEILRKQLQDVYLDLAVVDSKEITKIEELREKKNKIESDFTDILIEIVELLSPCLEEKAKTEYYRYLTYICTEKQTAKETYEPVWKTFEDFKKDDTGLTSIAIDKLQELLLNIKE